MCLAYLLIKNQLFITIKIIHPDSVTLKHLSSHKKRKKEAKTFETHKF